MELKFIKKTGFALSLLAAATIAQAGVKSNLIPCPATSTIQEAALKIDAAEDSDGMYIAYTSSPAFEESNLPWYVGAPVFVNSSEEAIKQGQAAVQGVNLKVHENATDHGNNIYSCTYQPGNVIAVGGDLSPVTLFKRYS